MFSFRSRISLNSLSLDMKLGRNVARTFLDYYKLSNLIKDNRPTNIHSTDGMSQTGKSKTGVGRDTSDRKSEKNQCSGRS
ncbi:hypothetical protein ILYODFUR_028388 [Ilyodon furcidens]|uniref:Uncharacterized protein n=1 Tax=Ilyodon furcidens TaxID=33524 RepID=A0ABV0T208_9TELE